MRIFPHFVFRPVAGRDRCFSPAATGRPAVRSHRLVGAQQVKELHAVFDSRLLVNVVEVVLHSLHRYEEHLCDFAVAATGEQLFNNFRLTLGDAVGGAEVVCDVFVLKKGRSVEEAIEVEREPRRDCDEIERQT